MYGDENIGNGSHEGIGVGLSEGHHIEWMEAICGIKSKIANDDAVAYLKRVNDSPGRRCFKTHSPLALLEPLVTASGKVIHVARNPKDVAGGDYNSHINNLLILILSLYDYFYH